MLQVVTQFKEQGINTELYYKNKEMGETFSIVPTSAIRFGLLLQFVNTCSISSLYYFDFLIT